MKKRGKLTGFFSGFAPISPKSAEKQHEKVLSASRKRQVPHYANHGAAPVILSRSAKRAKKSRPSTPKSKSAPVGKSVPCLTYRLTTGGGWYGHLRPLTNDNTCLRLSHYESPSLQRHSLFPTNLLVRSKNSSVRPSKLHLSTV